MDKQQLHTPVAPCSVFVAGIRPHGCRRHCSNCTDGAKSLPRSLHPTGCVTSLSVEAGSKEGASCSDQVYSKCDSWTSGYRPHITQVVNLWLVVDPNLRKCLHWQQIFQFVFGCDSKKATFANLQQEIRPTQAKRFTNAAKENKKLK